MGYLRVVSIWRDLVRKTEKQGKKTGRHVLEDPRQADRSAEKDDTYKVEGNSINQLRTFVSPFPLFVVI